MGEENMNPAGLGKLFICRKKDLENDPAPLPMQEVKLEPVKIGDVAFMAEDEQQEGEDGWHDKGGFSLTATATFEATPEQQKLFRRLTQGQGRLPRRRKKQVMNRMLRHEDRCRAIARLIVRPMFDKTDALLLTATVMFLDKVRGYEPLVLSEAEYHAAYLCLKRIEKKYGKYIKALESEE